MNPVLRNRLIGLAIAGLGVGLHQATGSHVWDGLASIAIGLVLAGVGVALGRQNRHLLIGDSADPRLRAAVETQLAGYPEIDSVDEVLTSVIGSGEVLVVARLDLDDTMTAAQVEAFARRIEREIAAAHPVVRHFFLDLTADHRAPAP